MVADSRAACQWLNTFRKASILRDDPHCAACVAGARLEQQSVSAQAQFAKLRHEQSNYVITGLLYDRRNQKTRAI